MRREVVILQEIAECWDGLMRFSPEEQRAAIEWAAKWLPHVEPVIAYLEEFEREVFHGDPTVEEPRGILYAKDDDTAMPRGTQRRG